MKHHAIPFFLLLSLAISGCLADMEEFEAYMLPCEEGKTICSDDGKQILKCVNHELVVAQFCPTQCSEGACECEEGETICSEDRKHLLICHDHQYVYQYCPYLCSNGACNTIPEDPKPTTKCTDEETKCAGDKGNKIYRCQSGKWEHVATCENACENGACTDKPVCQSDECTPNECPANQHTYQGNCEADSVDHCGKHDYQCALEIDGWKNGTCSQGQCLATECTGSYHLFNHSCELDSKEHCGDHNQDCRINMSGFLDGHCTNHECIATSCLQGYHLYQNACEPDDENHCGKHTTNCYNTIQGFATGACVKGECRVATCTDGYHLDSANNRCIADTNNCCGVSCSRCTSPHVCSKGLCTAQCDAPLSKCNNECHNYANDINHCGGCNQACTINLVSNSTNVSCSDSTCKATSCRSGYHVYNGMCEIDDIDHCGNHSAQCYVENATNIICSNGTCQVTACEAGYHVYNNACEADNLTHCGAHGSQCHVENATSYTCSAGKCVFTCIDGYQIYKNACRNNPEIIVVSNSTSISENSGKTIELIVLLSTQPDNQVIIKLKSSDESEIKILGPSILIFNEENWNIPQTVFLQAQDDSYSDGTQIVHIDLASTSTDPYFHGLNTSTEDIAIIDNESASISLTAAKTQFKPGQPNTTPLLVQLSAPPMSDVLVKLTVSNNEVVKLPKLDLVFTPDNWSTPQEMTMTVLPDAIEGDCLRVRISATASDSGSYNGLKSNDVYLMVYRNLNNPSCQ